MIIMAVAWVLLAMVGLIVNLYATADAKVDRYYAEHHLHKGTRLLVANANIRRERTRVLIQVAFLMAGILSLARPAPGPISGTRAWLGLAMMIASGLTVFNSFADRNDRKRLLNLIDEQEEHRRRNQQMHDRAEELLAAHDDFQTTTKESLARLEEAGDKAVTAAEKVATELASSQGRADAIETGKPGEAADAASKSEKNDQP